MSINLAEDIPSWRMSVSIETGHLSSLRAALIEHCVAEIADMHCRLHLRGIWRAGLCAPDAESVYNNPPVNENIKDVRRLISSIAPLTERRWFVGQVKYELGLKLAGQPRTTRAYVESVRKYHQERQVAA